MTPALDGREGARQWLFDSALPLWWDVGADRVQGGWFDRIDQAGFALPLPKRARVQARQVFVYAEAAKLGWSGPCETAVEHGISFLLSAYRRTDGLFRKAVTLDGVPYDNDVDLYDQAFVLLALASAYQVKFRPAEMRARAEELLLTLESRLAHSLTGYHEGNPHRTPLRSNPHMHLLEGLLMWIEQGAGPAFRRPAEAIIRLAENSLIDPRSGAIGEYYDLHWRFAASAEGGIREPGHQFEWAYLLNWADRLLGGNHKEAIDRLYHFGNDYGVDKERSVAIFSVNAAGEALDAEARLWSQTERLRTATVLGDRVAARTALSTLERFCDVPVTGLWLDRMRIDGTFVDEAAPASSFYHIVTGLLPLLQ